MSQALTQDHLLITKDRCGYLQAQRLPEASPQALEQLVAMGFDSGQAAQALRESANDVQGALAGLLG